MKKGFTLIEIIAVITVISILTLLIVPYILNSVNSKKNEISDESKKIIYDATDIYLGENKDYYPNILENVYCIKLETLVKNGKLLEPVKDFKSNKEIPLNYYIKTTIDDYNQYEYQLVDKCEENFIFNIDFHVSSSYSNEKKLSIRFPNGDYVKKYKIVSGTTKENIELNKEVTVYNNTLTLNFTSNGTIEAWIENNSNEIVIKKMINVNKIDSENPKLVKSQIVKVGKIKYNITDNNSGIKEYCVNNASNIENCTWKTIEANPTEYELTYTAKSTGSYYLHLKDVAGNIFINKTPVTLTNIHFCEYDANKTWVFAYKESNGNGVEQTFKVPCNGTYKLETWGAQGGGSGSYQGGYGAYSVGNVSLDNSQTLHIGIGGRGTYCTGASCYALGGYNGGGACRAYVNSTSSCGSGGGATSISKYKGLLSQHSTSQQKNDILIVSGGGGGGNLCNECCNYAAGGHGGGATGVGAIDIGAPHFAKNGGNSATGGTQSSGYAFGQGGLANVSDTNSIVGGGGGYYGGNSSPINGAGGGSGFIGKLIANTRKMYCYNCTASTTEATKTVSTTCVSETPTANCAKAGHGYAKITYLGN